MPKALESRSKGGRPSGRPALPRDVVEEVRSAARPGRAADAIRDLQRAVQLLDRADARGALKEADRAKAAAPRSASLREVRGLALYELGRWKEALAELQTYRRISGRADENHVIADCERALGRPERAVPLAEEALRGSVPPDIQAESVVVAASALADMGRLGEALALLRRIPTEGKVGRDYLLRLWYVTGDVLERMDRRDEAAAEFRRIVRHDSGVFDAAERLARLTADGGGHRGGRPGSGCSG